MMTNALVEHWNFCNVYTISEKHIIKTISNLICIMSLKAITKQETKEKQKSGKRKCPRTTTELKKRYLTSQHKTKTESKD